MSVGAKVPVDRLGELMLSSWYDGDGDFEFPPNVGECRQDGSIPGSLDYGVNHGAAFMVRIKRRRFVFFYLPVDF